MNNSAVHICRVFRIPFVTPCDACLKFISTAPANLPAPKTDSPYNLKFIFENGPLTIPRKKYSDTELSCIGLAPGSDSGSPRSSRVGHSGHLVLGHTSP